MKAGFAFILGATIAVIIMRLFISRNLDNYKETILTLQNYIEIQDRVIQRLENDLALDSVLVIHQIEAPGLDTRRKIKEFRWKVPK